jgi:hypothetical protein
MKIDEYLASVEKNSKHVYAKPSIIQSLLMTQDPLITQVMLVRCQATILEHRIHTHM